MFSTIYFSLSAFVLRWKSNACRYWILHIATLGMNPRWPNDARMLTSDPWSSYSCSWWGEERRADSSKATEDIRDTDDPTTTQLGRQTWKQVEPPQQNGPKMDPWNHRTPTEPYHGNCRSLLILTKKLTNFYMYSWLLGLDNWLVWA